MRPLGPAGLVPPFFIVEETKILNSYCRKLLVLLESDTDRELRVVSPTIEAVSVALFLPLKSLVDVILLE